MDLESEIKNKSFNNLYVNEVVTLNGTSFSFKTRIALVCHIAGVSE